MGTIWLFLAFGAAIAVQAYRKGYNPAVWFLTAGPLALLIVMLLPDTTSRLEPAERMATARWRGNMLGLALTMLVVALTAVEFLTVSAPESP